MSDLPAGAPASWMRQSGETMLAYSAFIAYRDLGPGRTQAQVAELEYSAGTVAQWSRLWRWRERCEDWTDHLAQEMAQEAARQARAMARVRALFESRAWQSLASLRETTIEALVQRRAEGGSVTAGDLSHIARAMDSAAGGWSEMLDAIGVGVSSSDATPEDERLETMAQLTEVHRRMAAAGRIPGCECPECLAMRDAGGAEGSNDGDEG